MQANTKLASLANILGITDYEDSNLLELNYFSEKKFGKWVEVQYDYEHDQTPWHYFIRNMHEEQGRDLADWTEDFETPSDALEAGLVKVFSNEIELRNMHNNQPERVLCAAILKNEQPQDESVDDIYARIREKANPFRGWMNLDISWFFT